MLFTTMLLDWLKTDGGALLSWYLLTLLAGIAVYPLIYRLMGTLPSRGYALARAAGLMLCGFLYWFLNSIGLLQNTAGSIILIWLIVFALSIISYFTWKDREPIIPWLRKNAGIIITTELIFVIMFVGWGIVRGLNNEMHTTEKPMEMAFLSATMRSATLPPHDPWMAGYDISYYYFGYVILAMLGKISALSNGYVFAMAIPLVFALTGTGVLGIAYDLVMVHLEHRNQVTPGRRMIAFMTGVLAAFFVVGIGNLGVPLLELPFQTGNTTPAYLNFWDIYFRQGDNPSCTPVMSANPVAWSPCYWWWFAYTRVLTDHNLNGDLIQIIDEFPNMSFIIADVHPHVLALPFAVLTLGLGFSLALRKRRLSWWEMLLYGIFIGGMTFLNSWDAVYIAFIIGVEGLRRLLRNGTGRFTRQDWLGIGGFAVAIGGLTALLYLPFFVGFRSQAGGILPNIIWPTRFQQFFMFFGVFIIILGIYLIVELSRAGKSFNWRLAFQVVGTILAVLVAAVLVIAAFSWLNENIRAQVYANIETSGGIGVALLTVITRRFSWGAITEGLLLLALLVVIGRLFVRQPRRVIEPDPEQTEGTQHEVIQAEITQPEPAQIEPVQAESVLTYSPATAFVLLLIAAGAVLTLVPDFGFLKDEFANRMNTVFKLYYQAWLMWGLASGFAVWSVLLQPRLVKDEEPRRAGLAESLGKPLFAAVVMILIIAGLLYPIYAIVARAWTEQGHQNQPASDVHISLDGASSLAASPDDYTTIQCLAQTATSDNDVVLEATKHGLAYSPEWGRVSALTGIPTLLGWDNHEEQWRGTSFDAAANSDITGKPADNRIDVATKIYNSTDWSEVVPLLKQYGITYIYVGPTERQNFLGEGLAKFDSLTPVCSSGTGADGKPAVAVYSVASMVNVIKAGN